MDRLVHSQWRVRAELGKRLLTVFSDERPIAMFPVGIGKPSTPTPLGEWQIKEKRHERARDIEVAVLELSTPQTCCLRGTPYIDSLGQALSGG